MDDAKFIVVKGAGGGGLGDRVRAVLVAILYAKLSGRTLCVDWTDGVYGETGRNAFDELFSVHGIPFSRELPEECDPHPPAWRGRLAKSLDAIYVEDGAPPWSRSAAIQRYSFDFARLDHPARVLVSWDFDQLDALRPFLDEGSRSLPHEALERAVYRAHLRPAPGIRRTALDLLAGTEAGRRIGVHARSTLEFARQKGQVDVEQYFRAVDRIASRIAGPTSVVLATDNADVEAAFRRRYASVISTSKWFAEPGEPLHLNAACPDRGAAARDALVDLMLLSECPYLVTASNSSFSIVARIASVAEPAGHAVLSPKVPLVSRLKGAVRRVVDPRLLGALDLVRFPHLKDGCGGPLNGQRERQRMVMALLKAMEIDTIVETGTHRGASARYFSDLCPGTVFTIEADDRFFGYSRTRLLPRRNVVTLHNDSRSGLRSLTTDARLAGRRILFYLDAHWGDDLPLAEELDIVFGHWPASVVLIDDFEVPDDPGYGFDDYGPGKRLSLAYTRDVQRKYALRTFFPAASSGAETGARRGCVCFVADPDSVARVESVSELRAYE